MWQEVATLAIIATAVAYLLHKLVISPALRRRRPDVPTSALVRRRKPGKAPACH